MKFQVGIRLFRLGKHIVRTVNSQYIRIGKILREPICTVSGAAAYIEYCGRSDIYSVYQVN